MLICLQCGKSFEMNDSKFCSQSCSDSYIDDIRKRVREAVDDDSSHTKKLSRD